MQAIRVKSYNYYNGGKLDTTYDETAVTPVVGLVVKPVSGVSLFANRIEGMQQGPTAPLDPALVNPGEIFAPFSSTQYEVGGKIRLGNLDASLALFRITQPSAFAVPVSAANPAAGQVYGLFGTQRNQGIELNLAGEIAQGLRFIGGISVVDAELTETAGGVNDGNKAVGVPDFGANANLEWDVAAIPGFTLTGRAVHTGKQPVNVANTLEIPSWTRFDLGARYVFAAAGKPVTLRLSVDNVADKRYWASSFDTFNAALLQGAPRTVKASASIDF